MNAKPEFQLGIVMAGAISAGAYSAGVMDFFFEALDAYEAAKAQPGWNGPTHDVRIPVLAGASAGGMTAAITALHAFRDITPVRPSTPPPPKSANRLYSSWVTDISIEALLDTTDLADQQTPVRSALCCDVLTRIVDDAFNMQGAPRERKWIGRGEDRTLRVMFTLTNLRGVPYSFQLFGSRAHQRYGMLNHGDYLDFCVGMPGKKIDGSHILDVRNTAGSGWNLFKTAALATGAFPVGLAPRLIDRPTNDYNHAQLVGYEENGRFKTIHPDRKIYAERAYPFISVDGGTIDNEPLELARRYLANGGHNDQNGESATKAVLLVAPFPNLVHVPDEDTDDNLIHVLPTILNSLIQQARFKPDELAKAENDKIFSRFMISPTRPVDGNPLAEKFPIASGTLNGFGGFLHESFRRHDYLLGRRNAQAFLRFNFGLPENNGLFNGYQKDREKWYIKGPDGQLTHFAKTVAGADDTRGLPIIPLTDELKKPIEIGDVDLPKPQNVRLDDLEAKIYNRSKAVIGKLLEAPVFSPIRIPGLSWLARQAELRYATKIATDKASKVIKSAVDGVKEAFKPPAQ